MEKEQLMKKCEIQFVQKTFANTSFNKLKSAGKGYANGAPTGFTQSTLHYHG